VGRSRVGWRAGGLTGWSLCAAHLSIHQSSAAADRQHITGQPQESDHPPRILQLLCGAGGAEKADGRLMLTRSMRHLQWRQSYPVTDGTLSRRSGRTLPAPTRDAGGAGAGAARGKQSHLAPRPTSSRLHISNPAPPDPHTPLHNHYTPNLAIRILDNAPPLNTHSKHASASLSSLPPHYRLLMLNFTI